MYHRATENIVCKRDTSQTNSFHIISTILFCSHTKTKESVCYGLRLTQQT
eukprot:m.79770 g.79770  ORF g.79770 m.79770 type:complete len:50 (+) comp12580_c0_seq1:729-878(+)